MSESQQSAVAPVLAGQVAKIAVDTRGQVRVEIVLPLHVAVLHAQRLLESYGASITLAL